MSVLRPISKQSVQCRDAVYDWCKNIRQCSNLPGCPQTPRAPNMNVLPRIGFAHMAFGAVTGLFREL
jgi:hypothetical protein